MERQPDIEVVLILAKTTCVQWSKLAQDIHFRQPLFVVVVDEDGLLMRSSVHANKQTSAGCEHGNMCTYMRCEIYLI